MNLSVFFKSIVDSDNAPVVICNISHEIIYMNPAAVQRYAKMGGDELIGRSLLDCHNSDSNNKIEEVVSWFKKSEKNSKIFTSHNPKENKDVYMIALRDDSGNLIGYYEKHEHRNSENSEPYSDICNQ